MIAKIKSTIIENKIFFISVALSLSTPFIYSVYFFSTSTHYLFTFFDHFFSMLILLSLKPLMLYFFTLLSPLFYYFLILKFLLFFLVLRLIFKFFNCSRKILFIVFVSIILVSQLIIFPLAYSNYDDLQRPETLKTVNEVMIPIKIKKNIEIGADIKRLENYLEVQNMNYSVMYLINSSDDCEIKYNAANDSDHYWCLDKNKSNKGYISMEDKYFSYYIYFNDNKVVKYSRESFIPQVDPVLLK